MELSAALLARRRKSVTCCALGCWNGGATGRGCVPRTSFVIPSKVMGALVLRIGGNTFRAHAHGSPITSLRCPPPSWSRSHPHASSANSSNPMARCSTIASALPNDVQRRAKPNGTSEMRCATIFLETYAPGENLPTYCLFPAIFQIRARGCR